MRTINITFSVTEEQWDFLRLGKCEKPNGQRIKVQLLSEAAKNLRWLSDHIMREAHEGNRKKPAVAALPAGERKAITKIERERRAADRRLKAGRKAGFAGMTAGEKDPRIGPGPMLGLTLSEAKAAAKAAAGTVRGKGRAKPKRSNHIDLVRGLGTDGDNGLDENNLYVDASTHEWRK